MTLQESLAQGKEFGDLFNKAAKLENDWEKIRALMLESAGNISGIFRMLGVGQQAGGGGNSAGSVPEAAQAIGFSPAEIFTDAAGSMPAAVAATGNIEDFAGTPAAGIAASLPENRPEPLFMAAENAPAAVQNAAALSAIPEAAASAASGPVALQAMGKAAAAIDSAVSTASVTDASYAARSALARTQVSPALPETDDIASVQGAVPAAMRSIPAQRAQDLAAAVSFAGERFLNGNGYKFLLSREAAGTGTEVSSFPSGDSLLSEVFSADTGKSGEARETAAPQIVTMSRKNEAKADTDEIFRELERRLKMEVAASADGYYK